MQTVTDKNDPRKSHDLEIISVIPGSSVLLGVVRTLHDALATELVADVRRARVADRIIARSRHGAVYILTGKGWAFGDGGRDG
jgi:hypothetical protein